MSPRFDGCAITPEDTEDLREIAVIRVLIYSLKYGTSIALMIIAKEPQERPLADTSVFVRTHRKKTPPGLHW